MRVALQLTPEQATKDAMNRAMANPKVMALARALQRAAFADQPDRLASMTGEFRVAPLYLSQAMAIAHDDGVAAELNAHLPPTKWTPPPIDQRESGFRCLAFHRGAWRDVMWVGDHQAWMFGYGSAMIHDAGRAFAPLPELPFGAGDFWANDYKGYGR